MHVRTYEERDARALADLFVRAGEGSPSGELWGDPTSERAVYLDPYVEHCAESLFLAEDGGRLVGYLTGCPDTAAMPSEDDLLGSVMASPRVLCRPSAVRFFGRAVLDLARARRRGEPTASGGLDDPRWPAHLHVNVLPEARGTGAAQALLDAWLSRLAERGCHLQTLVENERAVRFFGRSGFVAHGPTPPVPGVRYRGRRVHQLTMVRPG